MTASDPSFPQESAYKPPDGKPISNFGGEACGGPLPDILRVSCNSSFAEMGAEVLGPQIMQRGAAQFGFNQRPPIDLPAAATSTFPDTGKSKALLGQASIGQFETQASPLQMALVAAGIANNGVIMTPHVMKEIRDSNGGVLRTYEPEGVEDRREPADRGHHARRDGRRGGGRHRHRGASRTSSSAARPAPRRSTPPGPTRACWPGSPASPGLKGRRRRSP